jgi:hypothetical protein
MLLAAFKKNEICCIYQQGNSTLRELEKLYKKARIGEKIKLLPSWGYANFF